MIGKYKKFQNVHTLYRVWNEICPTRIYFIERIKMPWKMKEVKAYTVYHSLFVLNTFHFVFFFSKILLKNLWAFDSEKLNVREIGYVSTQ